MPHAQGGTTSMGAVGASGSLTAQNQGREPLVHVGIPWGQSPKEVLVGVQSGWQVPGVPVRPRGQEGLSWRGNQWWLGPSWRCGCPWR